MAAIITDDFRRNQARLLVNDIKASADVNFDTPASNSDETTWPYRGNNRYAIGLGKADKWPNDSAAKTEEASGFIVPSPNGTIQEDHDIINNLFTLKDVSSANVKQMIAKNAWTTGRKYKVYDQTDDDMFYSSGDLYPCVVTVADKIYMCLSNTAVVSGLNEALGVLSSSTSPSTVTSDFGVTSTPQADGYVWVHVATFDSNDSLATNQFSPVTIDAAAIIAANIAKTGGLLTHIGVKSGGSGYTSDPTVTLTLVKADQTVIDSSAISLVPIRVGGVITRIDIRDVSTNTTDAGSYEYWLNEASGFLEDPTATPAGSVADKIAFATVTITGGSATTPAEAYASIAPITGFGKNALDVLPTWFVGIHTAFVGSETNSDAPILKFRQVSLLKNFVPNTTEGDDGAWILDCLNSISVTGADSSLIGGLTQGDVLTAGTGAATSKFYFDYYTTTTADTGLIYYHQNSNSDVNMIIPPTTGGVSASGVSIATGISAVDMTKEYDIFLSTAFPIQRNGEVIFQENRQPFGRSPSQTEEVKLIIQL